MSGASPDASRPLSIPQLILFTCLLSVLKGDIILVQPVRVLTDNAPDVLPPTMCAFIGAALDIPDEDVFIHWTALKDNIWTLPEQILSEDEEALFREQ